MSGVSARYRRRADHFARLIAGASVEKWSNPSPCANWTALGVVEHVVMMHAHMLRSVDGWSSGPPVAVDPLAAFQAARAGIEHVLATGQLADARSITPVGLMSLGEEIDRVVSDDLPLHGWDLAMATGQDTTMNSGDVERLWAIASAIPAEVMVKYRTPGAFGPGIEVYGAEISVALDAPLQDRLLGIVGRDSLWTA